MIHGKSLVFPWLIEPMIPADFYANIYERQTAIFKDRVFECWESDRLFELVDAALFIAPAQIRVVNNGQLVAPPKKLSGLRRGIWARAQHELGATIVLNRMEWLHPPTKTLTDALSRELGARVSCTAFLTPENSRGFAPHFDTDDVFVLQIAGTKTWFLGTSEIYLPTTRQGYLVTAKLQDYVATTVELRVGDVLYIPRGVVHSATAQSESSIHLSLDVNNVLAVDVLKEAVHKIDCPSLANLIGKEGVPSLQCADDAIAAISDHLDDNLVQEAGLRKWNGLNLLG